MLSSQPSCNYVCITGYPTSIQAHVLSVADEVAGRRLRRRRPVPRFREDSVARRRRASRLTIKSCQSSPVNCAASSAGRPVSSPDAWASAMILRKPARLASRPIELSARSHFRGLNRLADRQSEYRNDRGVAYLADELRPEKEVSTCARVSRSRSRGRSAGTSSRLARSPMQAISISCLLPTRA